MKFSSQSGDFESTGKRKTVLFVYHSSIIKRDNNIQGTSIIHGTGEIEVHPDIFLKTACRDKLSLKSLDKEANYLKNGISEEDKSSIGKADLVVHVLCKNSNDVTSFVGYGNKNPLYFDINQPINMDGVNSLQKFCSSLQNERKFDPANHMVLFLDTVSVINVTREFNLSVQSLEDNREDLQSFVDSFPSVRGFAFSQRMNAGVVKEHKETLVTGLLKVAQSKEATGQYIEMFANDITVKICEKAYEKAHKTHYPNEPYDPKKYAEKTKPEGTLYKKLYPECLRHLKEHSKGDIFRTLESNANQEQLQDPEQGRDLYHLP